MTPGSSPIDMSTRCAKACDTGTARNANRTIWIRKEKRNNSIGNPRLKLNRASRIKSNSSGIGKPAALDILFREPLGATVKAWPIATAAPPSRHHPARAAQVYWRRASLLGRSLALDLGQLRPGQPLAPALAELCLCRFERRRVAIHPHVRRRTKNAGDRPEPLDIRGRAAFFINPTHGKFATEEGVVAA